MTCKSSSSHHHMLSFKPINGVVTVMSRGLYRPVSLLHVQVLLQTGPWLSKEVELVFLPGKKSLLIHKMFVFSYLATQGKSPLSFLEKQQHLQSWQAGIVQVLPCFTNPRFLFCLVSWISISFSTLFMPPSSIQLASSSISEGWGRAASGH